MRPHLHWKADSKVKHLLLFITIILMGEATAMIPEFTDKEKRSLCAQLMITFSIEFPDRSQAEVCKFISGPLKMRGEVVVDCAKYCAMVDRRPKSGH